MPFDYDAANSARADWEISAVYFEPLVVEPIGSAQWRNLVNQSPESCFKLDAGR